MDNEVQTRQGLGFFRLMMVFSSLSPLFVLWAIRGTALVPDIWFVSVCMALAILPSLILYLRVWVVAKQHDKKKIAVGSAEDNRAQVLTYLFAMLLPFYSEEAETLRELMALIVALGFIVFLFGYLNLYYVNICFAVFGYRTFMVTSPKDDNPHTGRIPVFLITYRHHITADSQLYAYRLSDTIYLERKP